MSLRGTSGSPAVNGEASIKLSTHVEDVLATAEAVLPPGQRFVMVGHSFGGLITMKVMEALTQHEEEGQRKLAGAACLCSVPPSGNGPMTQRFVKERPLASFKIVLGFVAKLAAQWSWLARDLFFDEDMDPEALARYVENFKADSVVGLDLRDVLANLPSKSADAAGRASWLDRAPPRLVMGSECDYIVDQEGVEEAAFFLGASTMRLSGINKPLGVDAMFDTDAVTGEEEGTLPAEASGCVAVMLPRVTHDVMLGSDWPRAASQVLSWLESVKA